MKHKMLTTLAAAGGFLALSVAPAWAADEDKTAATEENSAAVEAITVTTALIQGGGWGADRRVREALKAQDGIEKYVLSGLRATIFMEEGKTIDKEKLSKALQKGRLTLGSLEQEVISPPEAAYALTITGGTWASTNDKARVALEELEKVSAAYFNNGITLFMTEDAAPDKEALTKLLKKYRIKVGDMKKVDELPF